MKDKSMPDFEDITSSEMAARVRDALEDAMAHIDILTGTICQLAEAGAEDSDESLIMGGRCIAAKRQIVKAITSLLDEDCEVPAGGVYSGVCQMTESIYQGDVAGVMPQLKDLAHSNAQERVREDMASAITALDFLATSIGQLAALQAPRQMSLRHRA